MLTNDFKQSVGSQLHVRPEFGIDDLNALSERWERLDAKTFPRMPFSGPTWNLLWWKHFHQQSMKVTDHLFAHSIWNDAGELCGVAPLVITEQPSIGPLRSRKLQFFGADANVTEVRGLVCAPELESAIIPKLAQELCNQCSRWDFLVWQGIRSESGFNALNNPLTTTVLSGDTIPNYYLQPTGDFKSSLPRNVKESLRKCYNSLKRDNYETEFRVVQEEAEVVDAAQVFFKLHGARAGLDGTVAHGNVFASQLAQAFLLDFLKASAVQNRVRIFQLIIKGEVVATRIGFALGDHLYLYFSGYDPAWAKYSVMTTTLWEILQYAMRSGFSTINLSPGRDVSKTRWRPHELSLRSGIIVSPSWRGGATYRTYSSLERARNDPRLGKLLRPLQRRV